MKTRALWISLILVFSAGLFQELNARIKLGKAIFTVMTGAGAAESFKRASDAEQLFSERRKVYRSIRSSGLDPNDSAIYSIYFQVDPGTAGRWIFNPDIFLVVQIEGKGTYVVPRIERGYRGQALIEHLVSQNAEPGSKVVVHVLDDRHWTNSVWNSILQTNINLEITADVMVVPFIPVTMGANGSFSLLDRDVTIRPPEYMASATFEVPATETGDRRWMAHAELFDLTGKHVGDLQFARTWVPGGSYFPSPGEFIFWGIIGIGLLGVSAKYYRAM